MNEDISIHFEDRPRAEPLLTQRILSDPHTFRRDWIDTPLPPLPSLADEAEIVRSTKPLEVSDESGTCSVTTLVDRCPFLPLLRAIVARVWEQFHLPTSDGLDVGSGPEGIMARDLLPDGIDRRHWKQLELNPDSCSANRARGPTPEVLEGSYHRVQDLFGPDSHTIVTGLSTLDATVHQTHAIRQIAHAARSHLLHVQDMQPTPLLAPLTLMEMGYRPPFLSKTLGGRAVVFLPGENNFEPLYRMELFRRRIDRIITGIPGLELLCNGYVTATKPMPEAEQSSYYVQGMVFSHPVPRGEVPVMQASAVITLARKTGKVCPESDGEDDTILHDGGAYERTQARFSRAKCDGTDGHPYVRVALHGIPDSMLTSADAPAHSILAQTHVDGRYFQLLGDGSIMIEREPEDRLFNDGVVRPAKKNEATQRIILALQNECCRHFPDATITRADG